MLLVFCINFFTASVISRIESIGGGRAGGEWVGGGWGGGWGGWEAEGWLKQRFRLKQQCCAFSMGPELVQSTGWAKTAVRSSLVPHAVSPQGQEMHTRGLTASVKGHL